jgi:hypothetical protein
LHAISMRDGSTRGSYHVGNAPTKSVPAGGVPFSLSGQRELHGVAMDDDDIVRGRVRGLRVQRRR